MKSNIAIAQIKNTQRDSFGCYVGKDFFWDEATTIISGFEYIIRKVVIIDSFLGLKNYIYENFSNNIK